jgi:hypothetical protein
MVSRSLSSWQETVNHISVAAGYIFVTASVCMMLEAIMRFSYTVLSSPRFIARMPSSYEQLLDKVCWSYFSVFYMHDLVLILLAVVLVALFVRCKGPF